MKLTAINRRSLLLASLACVAAGRLPPDPGIPIDVANRRCVVRVLLDGRVARMVLDTGAERSVLTRAAAARLGLAPDRWVGTTLRGAGGLLETHPNVDASVATLGGRTLYQRLSSRGLSLSVTTQDLRGADGLLGGDVLRHFTIDLDVPRARLWLRPGQYAAPGPRAVDLKLWRSDLLLAPLRLDGHDLIALLDTGATTSLVNARGLYRLGVAPELLGRDPIVVMAGLGGKLPVRLHRFAALVLGPLTIPRPLMLTAPIPEPGFDLTLGLDVLGRQRLLLSYADLTLGFGP